MGKETGRMIGEPVCSTCKFYDEHCCHLNAPTPLAIPLQVLQQQGPPSPVILWPPVPDEGWCSHHQTKLTIS